MIKEKIKQFFQKKEGQSDKKTIENLVVFLIILIITVIVINVIWNGDDKKKESPSYDSNKKLATEEIQTDITTGKIEDDITERLEDILMSIEGVGRVKVMLTYAKTSQVIPIYNEDITQKNTEETDQSGGTRKITEADTNKQVVFQEENGEKIPIMQSTVSPQIEGAIITAEGAGNASVKTNIIQAVEAVTGLATHKVQVFEMKST